MASKTCGWAIWFPRRCEIPIGATAGRLENPVCAVCALVQGQEGTPVTAVEQHDPDARPVAHVTITYLGPVAPHWEMRVHYGDQKMLDDFWTRVNARLLLLPKHDPQFRRNRERVNRDAERELIVCDWDLGDDDSESTVTHAGHHSR